MQKPKLKLKLLKRNITKAQKLLQKKLESYNASKLGDYKRGSLVLCYYDGKKMVAGLDAYQHLGLFFIRLLWVDESYRRQGLGSKLLKMAEQHAAENKDLYIRANTGSFQAPKFYLKNGYQQFAKLPLVTTSKKKHYDYYFIKCLK